MNAEALHPHVFVLMALYYIYVTHRLKNKSTGRFTTLGKLQHQSEKV
jgi:hypothetical protein